MDKQSKLSWPEKVNNIDNRLLKVISDEIVHYKIVPDTRLENRTQIIANALNEIFAAPRDRLSFSIKPPIVTYKTKDRAFFDILIEPENVSFYLSTPSHWARFAEFKAKTVWTRAAISSAAREDLNGFDYNNCTACDVRLRKANLFSIKTGRQDLDPLNSLLAVLHDLKTETEDRIRVSFTFDPICRLDWMNNAEQSHRQFKSGNMPRRLTVTREDIWQYTWKSAGALLNYYIELRMMLFDSLLFFMRADDQREENYRKRYKIKQEVEREVHEYNIDGGLSPATTRKLTAPAFHTFIRVISQSSDSHRREINLRTVANSFKDLNADNEFQTVELPRRIQLKRFREAEKFILHFRFDPDVLSDEEVAKLIQLPQATLQDEYPQIDNISNREVDVNQALTTRGIHIGDVSVRGKNVPVHFPTSNYDELCLPRVIIGGMGCGKTRGYGGNFAVQVVKNGFGALVIDPAKGEMGDEIEAGLPREQVRRIRIGDNPIALDWCEVKYSPRALARLANTIISFFTAATDDTGAQTARYIRAAVMAMQTGRLAEILKILEDPIYRAGVIQRVPAGINRTTLENFGHESDSRQRQILAPIYNRMDTILGDPYLSECMNSKQSIDMVQVLSQNRATIIDVPKSALGPEGVDLIVNLLSTKIDLAMTLRPEDKQHPFFVIFDEPHQYLRSGRIWRSASVESRKWRLGYVWMFHSWEQIPPGLAEIIKSAGPHYSIYRSSKKTYEKLAEEIAPYTVEEALKTSRFWAINIIQADGDVQKPFMAKMAAPPSMQRKKDPGKSGNQNRKKLPPKISVSYAGN